MKNKLFFHVSLWLMCFTLTMQSISFNTLIAHQPQKTYAFINPTYEVGMFSHFLTLMGFLDFYDQGAYTGVKLDFGHYGLYYEPQYGSNWWEYYFEPIDIGSAENATIAKYDWGLCHTTAYYVINHVSRARAYELIQKYIKVKPYISEAVDEFVNNQFQSDFIIGVHYRGTDKITSGEAGFVAYNKVLQAIQEEIATRQLTNFKIFIATDEKEFLKVMEAQFPDQIVYQEAIRSTTPGQPVHIGSSTPYQMGKEAVLDALLLSRCDCLIRTSSNLSLCSTYFNQSMSVTILQ